MPVRFLKNASEIADVSFETPLPVALTNEAPIPADTLFIGTFTANTTADRDLLGNTATEIPTLDNCGAYRKLYWFYHRASDAATTYWVYARATDLSGTPLASGWQQLATGALPGGANSWERIDIPATTDGYYDQYRIVVQRTAGSDYTLTSKIVGVR